MGGCSLCPGVRNHGSVQDSAGNLVLNTPCPQPPGTPFTPTYSYNAENQLVSTAGVTYTYDGDGKRAKKSNGKLYWYGMGSDPLTETDLTGTPIADYIFFNGKRVARPDLPSGAVHYYFSDHLGSASVVTSATGTIQDESDYYPFGAERIITNADPNQYKFTGKERDSESGLDFFSARYYTSNLGRFTSPDEFAGGPVDSFSSSDPLPPGPLPYADITNAQSLNKYTYTYNDPLRYVDPHGHCPPCTLVPYNTEVVSEVREIGNTVITVTVTVVGQVGNGAKLLGRATLAGTMFLALQMAGDNEPPKKKDDTNEKGRDKPGNAQPGPQAGDNAQPGPLGAVHKKGARPSTEQKHQEGRSRGKRDKGGEKADEKRKEKGMWPRKPPGGKTPKGGWPPKPKKTDQDTPKKTDQDARQDRESKRPKYTNRDTGV